MTSGPIEKRLRDATSDENPAVARAAAVLRSLPPPRTVSESARRRALAALRGSPRSLRRGGLTMLQAAAFLLLVAFSAVASAKRLGWNPFAAWFTPAPPAVVAAAPTPTEARRAAKSAIARAPETAEPTEGLPTAKVRASVKPKPSRTEPTRPRLLSDPQNDPIVRVFPKPVYDAQTYSVLLDVCVSAEGTVERVSVVRGADASVDRRIAESVERWSYAPAEANGRPVPMCFPLMYRVQVQRD